MHKFLIGVILVFIVCVCTYVVNNIDQITIDQEPSKQEAFCSRVVDGDTIVVKIGLEEYKVRYIGIDTPETVDPNRPAGYFGKEASQKNRELVLGRDVRMEKDVSDVDKYGRLLRYVYVGDTMINAELVRLGYAKVATYPPDIKYASLFVQMERDAMENNRGLWGK